MNHSNLIINYGKVQVKQGNFINMYRTLEKPYICYPFIKNNYYCLIMVDIDSPSIKNPIYKYWLHWMIVNIHYNIDLINNNIYGLTLIKYLSAGPEKNTGPHRYIFFLYKQPYNINFNNEYLPRIKFNLNNFVNKYNFKLLDFNYFKCEYPKFDI